MALAGKMEREVEIKSGHEILNLVGGKNSHHAPNLVPQHVTKVDLHEGEWGDHGSVKAWTCIVDGKVETYREKITLVDEENKAIHLTAIEGTDLLEQYKSFKVIFQFIPKGETNVLKITIEYEKQNEDVPPPHKYMNYLANQAVKDLDAKLVQA